MKRSIATLIALGLLVGGCIHATQPSAERMSRDVQKLESTFPAFEELRVRGFRNQDWCRFIDYPRGAFTNLSAGDDSDTCNLFAGQGSAFDQKAIADFERVRRALDDSGVRGDWVLGIRYDASGRLTSAQFAVEGGLYDRWAYVYDPGGALPENMEGEEMYTRVNDDWYFWWEDWN